MAVHSELRTHCLAAPFQFFLIPWRYPKLLPEIVGQFSIFSLQIVSKISVFKVDLRHLQLLQWLIKLQFRLEK
jgi:hypothetical protein